MYRFQNCYLIFSDFEFQALRKLSPPHIAQPSYDLSFLEDLQNISPQAIAKGNLIAELSFFPRGSRRLDKI